MTTPQPQPMKRYGCHKVIGRLAEHPDGQYVRHDDPALVAAMEAMEDADELLSDEPHPSDGGCIDTFAVRKKLRLALAGLQPKEQQ